ncbi:hypothetical protein CS535_19645 [Yersinia massiliensis]|uniref:Uncharacterized protein n=2 Tax=Yersinia massiliensis TaxID=419257 RepID=A0ABM6UTC5_9GAMM|nr:hypothetical protein DA391_12575 [Yersinia massiliensis]OWF70752.1 hypothetical protein B4902_21830 [Yersinia frederiksenii]PHZ22040.1 hypothetical protein CS535_19645 [Yersinia massiliensis]CFR26297.1 Uncharacterised protein [Yersinia frederiksenii]CNF72914.1 Uncharacterised protein [Yersinia frederiksenii]
MLILCNSTSGKDLPDNARVMGETEETKFTPLEIGVEYKVYGVMFYSNRTDFLLCPEENMPLWVPSNLFEVLDDRFPNDWGCVITEKKEGYVDLYEAFGISAICGYLELVRSYQHYLGILEREPSELQKFYMYKTSY